MKREHVIYAVAAAGVGIAAYFLYMRFMRKPGTEGSVTLISAYQVSDPRTTQPSAEPKRTWESGRLQ